MRGEERKGEHRKSHTSPLDLGELGQICYTSWRNSVEYVIRLNVGFEYKCGRCIVNVNVSFVCLGTCRHVAFGCGVFVCILL